MLSSKIIKKLAQLAVILLLIVVAFPATAFILLQSSRIQTSVADRVMKVVSEELGTRFTISKIDIAFLYRVRLNDVYLQDMSGDTLIYVKSLTAGIRYFNPVAQKVTIGSLNFEKADLALAIDSVNGLNLSYFINKLSGNKQGKGGWTVQFANLRLRNSRFSLKNYGGRPVGYGINFSDIRVYDIDADVRQFRPSKDSLSFFVKSLSLKEKSGFILDKLSASFSQSRTFLSFRDVVMKTPYSVIKGDEIIMRFMSYNAFKADSFVNKVRLRINLSQARFDLADIGYFAPVFQNMHQQISFSGLVTGPVNNIHGKDLIIGFGNHSKLRGNLNFEGLPDIRQTFIIADIKEFTTSAPDINQIQLLEIKGIELPGQLKKLGQVTYAGNFTGFINDFVAYGKFNTDLGIVKTDLSFRPGSSNLLDFQGKLNVQDFDLGTLMDATDNIGNISLTASIDGATVGGTTIDAVLKGNIEQFEFRKYNYTNISLSGNLKDKTFNGLVNIHDPNIDLEFLGKVNLTDSIPVFDFTANITNANLYALNISKADPSFRASCYLIANARGKSINSLNGDIKLLNSLFIKNNKQLQIYDLSVISESRSGFNRLQLHSDFMDADVSGDFELSKSGETFRRFIYNYLPSLMDSSGFPTDPLQNTITLTTTIKNIKPVLEFFLPDYSIAENSSLNLSYKPEGQQMTTALPGC